MTVPVLLELVKFRLTAAVALSAGAGYLLAAARLGRDLPLVMSGVFLLAAGAAAFNQIQDARLDSKMARTRRRPIPSGRLSRAHAFFLACILTLLGLGLLASTRRAPLALAGLGAAAAFWYNGVYTYLKRVTAFAAVPGALIGAAPPFIGWLAAGGEAGGRLGVLTAGFFFLWQIPHFWLLQLMRADEYRLAGLPVLGDLFSGGQLRRITAAWILAAAAAGVVFPASSWRQFGLACSLGMLCAPLWLGAEGIRLWLSSSEGTEPCLRAFRRINAYALLMGIFLSLGALRRILLGP